MFIMASGFYIIKTKGKSQIQVISIKEKATMVTIPSQIKTVREERRLQVLLLLLPLLLLSMQIFL